MHIRRYDTNDEPEVLALWERALPQWRLSAESFRQRTREGVQLVALDGEVIAGYLAAAHHGAAGQLTAAFVDPAARRRRFGSALLARACEAMSGQGVQTLAAGSGVGPYFWPGVPTEDLSGWEFLRAHGLRQTGETADLILAAHAFRAPAGVMSRIDSKVRYELARERDRDEILNLQRRNFPFWEEIYVAQLQAPETVLLARHGHRIIGTCTVEGPAEHDLLWRVALPGPLGVVGCVGVRPRDRGTGIGLGLVARAGELIAERGAEWCVAEYTDLWDWYGRLGFTPWHTYTMAQARLADVRRTLDSVEPRG